MIGYALVYTFLASIMVALVQVIGMPWTSIWSLQLQWTRRSLPADRKNRPRVA